MTAPAAPIAGSADLTHRHVLAIALPIIIANISTPLIGIVDTAVLGQLGDAHYIGAVAIGAMIFNMVYWAFGFLRMGTTGLTAQAEGSGNAEEVAATLWRALVIAAVCGLALVILQWPISVITFVILEGSEPVETGAHTYFQIRIWSAPAALANYAFLGWFIGQGRATTAMALQVLLNGTNAILDALFVLGFGWGVEGVAYGTLIAEVSAAACGLWIALGMIRRSGVAIGIERIVERTALTRVLSMNADIMIRTLCVLFAFSWFTAKSAQVNDVVLAANAILLHFSHLAAYFLDGFAFSTETLVGQAIGAGRQHRFRRAVKLSGLWAVILSVALTVGFFVFGGLYIDLLTVNPEIRAEARLFLIWAALVPVAGVACYQLDGIFIGATRTADMRNMMMLSLAVYLVSWMILTGLYGNHGLWAALMIFLIVRGITLGVRF
ncbi:MAG: MATE family efflux transporter, partial [Alphaproteobacteria bacterium]|nr:MATE family efflux transporter [Alphaproteobacteria bacterium]